MKKYKIGYTTGVFDLFHIGHLNILKKSKEQCDYLIVGVSTDELVKNYKNKIPTICLEERMEIVKAIKYVDKVVIQESMDKFEAWKKLKFNVMFHGDDWKESPTWKKYKKQFDEVGVDLVYFPYTKQTSSSLLRNRLENENAV
mgnify:CR=1 FL=1